MASSFKHARFESPENHEDMPQPEEAAQLEEPHPLDENSKESAEKPVPPVLPVLPEVTMLMIFDNLSLLEVITAISLVSRYWNEVAREYCRKRKHLVLLINNPRSIRKLNLPEEYDPKTHLKVSELTRFVVHDIARIFPRVTRLETRQLYPFAPQFFNLIALLQQWSSTLNHIHIRPEWTENETVKEAVKKRNFNLLFKYLNSMTQLKHFKLTTKQSIFNHPKPAPANHQFPSLQLPFMAQLETFEFSTGDYANILFPSLQQYAAPNEALSKIYIRCLIHRLNEDELQIIRQNDLIKRFEHLHLQANPNTLSLLNGHEHWTSGLTYLEVNCSPQATFFEVLRSLPRLTKLHSLFLEINMNNLGNFELFWHAYRNMTKDNAPRLANLKYLRLFVTGIRSHNVLNAPHLAEMFPLLRTLTIVHKVVCCTMCQYQNVHMLSKERFKSCLDNFVDPWRQCPKLKAVKLRPASDINQYKSLVDTYIVKLKV